MFWGDEGELRPYKWLHNLRINYIVRRRDKFTLQHTPFVGFQGHMLWVVTPRSVVVGYQRFRDPCCLHLQQPYTASQPRRPQLENYVPRCWSDFSLWRNLAITTTSGSQKARIRTNLAFNSDMGLYCDHKNSFPAFRKKIDKIPSDLHFGSVGTEINSSMT